jgi:hypothetical protein
VGQGGNGRFALSLLVLAADAASLGFPSLPV